MSGDNSEKPEGFLIRAKKWHPFLHVILLLIQVAAFGFLSYTANTIASQNAQIQEALYNFQPRISGYCGIIWLRAYEFYSNYQTYADVKVFIISPHPGEFNLTSDVFYPFEDNVDMNYSQNKFYMQTNVRDITYPQAYKYEASVPLSAWVKPDKSIGEMMYVGKLEFKIGYTDSQGNSISQFFNASVFFELIH